MTNVQVCTVIVKPNAWSVFWARVHEHEAQGLVPAGQVNPPPQPQPKTVKILVADA